MFNIVCVNIAIMMVTDSVFSAIGPYFWMGDVFINNNLIGKLYAAATSLFYITNSCFVCLLLYVIYYFGTHGLAIYFFLTAGGNPGFADEGSDANIGMHRILKRERSDDTLSLGSEESANFTIDNQYTNSKMKYFPKINAVLELKPPQST